MDSTNPTPRGAEASQLRWRRLPSPVRAPRATVRLFMTSGISAVGMPRLALAPLGLALLALALFVSGCRETRSDAKTAASEASAKKLADPSPGMPDSHRSSVNPEGDPEAGDDTIRVDSQVLYFHPFDRELDRIDRLRWRNGFELTSEHPRFGGFSGLVLHEEHLVAVSDRGQWWVNPLTFDAAGVIQAFGPGHIYPILGPDGLPVEGRDEHDAEEISPWGDRLLVGFEGDHRLHLYASGDHEDKPIEGVPVNGDRWNPFEGWGRRLSVPDAFADIDENGGLEAITRLTDGRLLIFAEEGRNEEGDSRGWVGDPTTGEWSELSLALTVDPNVGDLRPTAAATMPSGDVVLLERGWQPVAGVVVKVSLIPAATIEPGKRLQTLELGRLQAPLSVDNFEALEATEGPSGETFLFLLADDNFRDDQRTLLLQLEVLGS